VAIKPMTHDFPTDGFFTIGEPSQDDRWQQKVSAQPAPSAQMGAAARDDYDFYRRRVKREGRASVCT
jgi:hypothetical protein